MGQGWSGEYPAGEAYGNTGINSSVGLGPRIRADSEPPTSAHYGGTKLDVTIPEDEEINATHSNLAQFTKPMASADWKRASTDSGILKEKPGQLATLLESKVAASSTFSDQASLNNRDIILNPPKPRDRSQSVGCYSHFADFSLFPDKFVSGPIKRRHPSTGSNLSEDEKSIPCTPPSTPSISTPLQSVKEAFFRTRALSYDPERDSSHANLGKSPSMGATGVNIGEPNENKTDQEGQSTIRPRSSSYGGGRKYSRQKGVHADRKPFADYTLFPDKDPKCIKSTENLNLKPDKGNGIVQTSKTKETELPENKINSTLSTIIGQPPTVIITPDNVNYINSAVLIASALTMEANKQSRYEEKPKTSTLNEKNFNNNNNVGKHAQGRFNFFDYSMIPDKDPKAFVSKNKMKKQHEEMFGKDKN